MSNFMLVLARHNEDISWLVDVPQVYNIIIYETSEKFVELTKFKRNKMMQAIRKEDAGQEAAAYLTYIINNYEKLSDYIVFSQANPHDHLRSAMSFLMQEYYNTKYKEGFVRFGYSEDEINWESGLVERACKMRANSNCDYSAGYLKYFKKKFLPDNQVLCWKTPAGAIFGVSRELILLHSRAFYEEILDWCSHAPTCLEVAILEKVWPMVFYKEKGK